MIPSFDKRQGLAIVSMSVPLAIFFIDMFGFPVCLPQIQAEFLCNPTESQWVINSYLLTLSILTLFGGRLGDVYGYHKIIITGLLLVFMASLLCSQSFNVDSLILGRMIQGCGVALLLPNATALLFNLFPFLFRNRAIGLQVGGASIFLVLAPILAGIITDYLNWRYLFFLNIPLLLVCALLIPYTRVNYPKRVRVNYSLSSFFVFDKELLRNKPFLLGVFANFFLQMAFITFIFRSMWLQNVLEYSPALIGFLSLPASLPSFLLPPFAGKLADRKGAKYSMLLGFSLCILGMGWIAATVWYQAYWVTIPGLLLLGIGFPFAITPLFVATIGLVNPTQRGLASGFLNASRQLGGAIGVSTLTIILITKIKETFYHVMLNQSDYLNFSEVQRWLEKENLLILTLSDLENCTQVESNLVKHFFNLAYTAGLAELSYIAMIFLVLSLILVHKIF